MQQSQTELAKKYICTYAKEHYKNVIWINAENDKTIAGSFYRLASDKLGIKTKNADREEKHVKSIIEEVFKSFSTQKSLFVFDNVEGLGYLKQILPLNNLMPNVKIPYILITSRSKEWDKKVKTIDLDTLSLDDSIKFIKKGLEIEDESQNDQIGNLVKELQYFPLAIHQAIAHIKETQESYNFEGYLGKYREKTKELINHKVFEWVNNGYTKTTYTVWEVTLDRIIEDKEYGQLALDILSTIAYFAPKNIGREMFLSLAGGSQTKLESAINLLVNYSMVNDEQKQSLSVHRLVQEVTRLKLREQQKEEEVLKKALELIKSSTIKKENISHVTSVLDYASRYNKLINNFDFTYRERKYTPLNLLIEGNREEGVKNMLDNLRRERYPSKLLKVINTLDEYGYSPLRVAIENSNLQIVKYLIENGADLDIKYEKGLTPLHFAALFGDLELARYLVDEKDCSFNVLDKYGKSPLHIASENGRIELVKYLVGEKKANINVLDNQHMAPLHFVAENGNLELAKYLIEKGADFFLCDKFGFNPIARAIDRSQDGIVKYLIGVKDRFGYTYLHKAAFDGDLDLFKLLINHNADLYRVDNDGSSPLHRAAENGKLEIVRYIIDKKLYNIDAVNNDKQTPLLLAAQNGHLEIVKFLVDKGADFFLPDKFGFTPLKRAIDRGHEKVKEYLEEKGRSIADECLPSPSYRQKREAESKCLFTWEDVDEFNEEKDERRNLGKIKIDGEKFIDYIKDLPEGKQDQLIQLADKVRIVGNSQGLVSKLTSNQKVMNHLSKVGKISVMTMHGMMAKNVLADFLNGDYKGVAINIGFIAGGQGFAKVAEIASLKGLKLASEGKLLLGRSLKAASPFLARGTSAFVVYDLVNQIKAFKNGTEEALVGVVGDSIYLGVDAAEIGIEIAEAFEVLEGVSSVTGPIGAAVGAVVFIGTDIYMAVKRVDKIDEIVHLTGGEKIIEGLRAFVGMKPEQYIEELMERKQLNDQLVKQRLEYLKEHNSIQRYVFPTKKSIVDSCETFTREIVGMRGHFKVLESERCKVKVQDDLDNVAFLDKKVSNVIYERAKPDNPNEGKLFCLPTDPIRPESGGESAYLCHDTIGLDYQANRTGDYTLITLGKGRDRAIGFKYSPNVFLVDDGDKDFTGGNKDDLFILVGNRVKGRLDGGGGNNTLNLAEFSLNENLNIKPDSHKNDSSISSFSNDIRIKNMNIIYGRKGKQDIVDCGCDVKYIDGQGGLSNNTPDNITIPYCYRPNEKKVIVRPSTEINNLDQSSNGNFDYIILPDKGKAKINIEPDFSLARQRKHNFLFNYTLFDLASVDIKNIKDINHWHAGYGNMTHTMRNVTFSFLSTLSKGKSINEKFDITISDIPANASYILSDNTEIKIGKNNLYAMHSTDKTIDEIVENYPTIADHLRMSLFISTNNETVVMGHGNHDIINNNFLQKSHLIGSGGANVYVITSGHEILDIENLPISEVVIYDYFNKKNSLKDTLDLRQLVGQVNGDLSIEPISKIIKDKNDLLIKLSISATALKQDVITVRLKDAFVNNWYKELQVILNNAPMKISSELELKPLPLIFDRDKEVIVVAPQEVEEKSELIISKEAGQYTFLYSGGLCCIATYERLTIARIISNLLNILFFCNQSDQI
ncbi:ankyrin repeat domain-containing protein [Wolbachia endosymbiont (group A) of Urophora cardui]|uniref:ankyrin repeat domain-containing protein n=1 Tax=Wolbachia endosymbiont (group A) of Urophora cardui TaxID=3066156 RepID=UPI0033416C62